MGTWRRLQCFQCHARGNHELIPNLARTSKYLGNPLTWGILTLGQIVEYQVDRAGMQVPLGIGDGKRRSIGERRG